MALGSIDLNLLAILQALIEEGNVTRAGMRVGMPQPAMSIALARLRRHYKDELLVRTANGYELTPLARSLLPSVQESTRLVAQAFIPAQSRPPAGEHMFTLGLSDCSMTVLGQPLLQRVRELAPNVRLRMRLATPDKAGDDRRLLGYDVLVAPAGFWPDGQPEVITRDRLVYVADPANPRLRDGTLTVDDLQALPHAAARLPHPGADPATAALARLGVTPTVVVTTGGWLPLAFLVSGTDLVAAIPQRLARRVCAAAAVTVVTIADPLLATIELVEAAWWHPMRATDPALTWLRTTLHDIGSQLDGESPDPCAADLRLTDREDPAQVEQLDALAADHAGRIGQADPPGELGGELLRLFRRQWSEGRSQNRA
jgi:DNA-binding transcriptional LysR family regulator